MEISPAWLRSLNLDATHFVEEEAAAINAHMLNDNFEAYDDYIARKLADPRE